MMVGICAGYGEKVFLQDIIFASSAINYEEGSVTASGGFESDSAFFGPDSSADQCAREMKFKQENLKIGTMISGSAVRRDVDAFVARSKSLNRNIVALDMEASAFYEACEIHKVISLGVVKSVVDLGDGKKNDDLHPRCLRAIAKFFLQFLLEYFGPRFPDESPGNPLVDLYFRLDSQVNCLDALKEKIKIGVKDGKEDIVRGTKKALAKTTHSSSKPLTFKVLRDQGIVVSQEQEQAISASLRNSALEVIRPVSLSYKRKRNEDDE